MRVERISCFLDAWTIATTKGNIRSGFFTAGLVPCNSTVPLTRKFIPASSSYLYETTRRSLISGKLLTSAQEIEQLQNKDIVLCPGHPEKSRDEKEQWRRLATTFQSRNDPDGHLLSAPTAFLSVKRMLHGTGQIPLFGTGDNLTYYRESYMAKVNCFDYANLERICNMGHANCRTAFICADAKLARQISESFSRSGRKNILISGFQKVQEREGHWDEFRADDTAILIATKVVIREIEPGVWCRSVLCPIPESDLLLETVHAWGDVVLLARNDQEKKKILALPRKVIQFDSVQGESREMAGNFLQSC